MKASEARKITINNQYKSFDEIVEWICNRATHGHSHLILEDKLSDFIMSELVKNKYKLEQFKKLDEYYIKIMW